MSYPTWQEALAALVKEKGLEDSELGDIVRRVERYSKKVSDPGSPNSIGPVGARGRSESLTRVADTPFFKVVDGLVRPGNGGSDRPDRARNDASPSPVDGSNTYQGRTSVISWRSSGPGEDEFTVTVCFDSRTASRLKESLFGPVGIPASGGVTYSRMTLTLEPFSTLRSTSRKNRSDGTLVGPYVKLDIRDHGEQ